MGAVIESICKKRQDEGTVGKHLDLLDTLLTEHESEGGPPLTFQQVNDLVFTTLVAGMDTSSSVLSLTMMYLLESPDVLDKLLVHVFSTPPAIFPTTCHQHRW